MVVFMNCFLVNHAVDATNSGDVNVLNVSLCVLHNDTQLHLSCTPDYEQQGGENLLNVMDDINTLKIPKHLCGYYEDSQGSYS